MMARTLTPTSTLGSRKAMLQVLKTHPGHADIVSAAIWTLGILARTPDHQVAIVVAGGIPVCIDTIGHLPSNHTLTQHPFQLL